MKTNETKPRGKDPKDPNYLKECSTCIFKLFKKYKWNWNDELPSDKNQNFYKLKI